MTPHELVNEPELDRWLTPARIARSDLMQLVFEGMRAGAWDQEAAMDIALGALRTFGNGCCYFLASVVASATDRQVVGFWRRSGDDRLVHAVVHDPRSGEAVDILGLRPLTAVRGELVEVVGPVRTTLLPCIDDEFDPGEREVLGAIAAGMPWMGTSSGCSDLEAWRTLLMEYCFARSST